MTPAQYRRKRDRIEYEAMVRPNRWRKRAMAHLNQEAGAEPLIVGKKVVAHRLGSRVVCLKQRFQTEDEANQKMAQIAQEPDGRVKPIRAYPCYTCCGWHVTHQRKHGD